MYNLYFLNKIFLKSDDKNTLRINCKKKAETLIEMFSFQPSRKVKQNERVLPIRFLNFTIFLF